MAEQAEVRIVWLFYILLCDYFSEALTFGNPMEDGLERTCYVIWFTARKINKILIYETCLLMLTFPLAVPPATPIKNGVLLSNPLLEEYSDDFSAIFCVNIDLNEFLTPKTPKHKPARALPKTADIDITTD